MVTITPTDSLCFLKNVSRPLGLLAAGLGLAMLAGCGKSEPQYYEVQPAQSQPEDAQPTQDPHAGHDHSHMTPEMLAQHMGQQVEAALPQVGFAYTLPEGWSVKPASRMVLLSFLAGNPPEMTADVSISSFPGDVGGQLANVNRWRRQVGLGPVAEEALSGFIQPITISGLEGWQVDFTGPDTGTTPTRMVTSVVMKDGTSWFYKLMGPAPAVEAQLAKYHSFIESVQF